MFPYILFWFWPPSNVRGCLVTGNKCCIILKKEALLGTCCGAQANSCWASFSGWQGSSFLTISEYQDLCLFFLTPQCQRTCQSPSNIIVPHLRKVPGGVGVFSPFNVELDLDPVSYSVSCPHVSVRRVLVRFLLEQGWRDSGLPALHVLYHVMSLTPCHVWCLQMLTFARSVGRHFAWLLTGIFLS